MQKKSCGAMALLDDDRLASMGTAKIFKDNENMVNSLDFSLDGNLLLTSADDESVHVYDVRSATLEKTVWSKKYGVDLARFTHSSSAIVCASRNGWDDTLRYLSLHDNRYLRYFKGHRDRVTSLSVSPLNDWFISSSLDGTVRLWDLKSSACQGLLRRRSCSPAAVEFDPTGLVFAVATGNNTLKLYNAKVYDGGPFLNVQIEHSHEIVWSQLQWSPDGKYILLSDTVDSNMHWLVDSFNGNLLRKFSVPDTHRLRGATFSPDSQHVLSGIENGSIMAWRIDSGELVHRFTGHIGPVGCIAFNPRYLMFASACSNVHFWIAPKSSSSSASSSTMIDDDDDDDDDNNDD
jgi:COMPASS component SWD2